MFPSDFEKLWTAKPRAEYKKLRKELEEAKLRAENIADDLGKFSWTEFEERLLGTGIKWRTLKEAFHGYINSKELALKTIDGYWLAYRSLERFFNSSFIKLDDVTSKKITAYRKSFANSDTTLSIYLRKLKAVLNMAMELGYIDVNPISHKDIPIVKKRKSALTIHQIGMIATYEPSNEKQRLARDLWLFMYYANGINFKDLAMLKYSDQYTVLDGDKVFRIVRNKSKTTRKEIEYISIPVLDKMQIIIDEWGNEFHPSNYVFPILEAGLKELTIKNRIKKAIDKINAEMKLIAMDLGLQASVTTSVARHSFATVMAKAGAPALHLADSMGHSSVRTTEIYLKSFEDESLFNSRKALTAFENEDEKVKDIRRAN